jgi:hypothetical protein
LNYIEIDKLKNIFSNIQKDQNTIRCVEYGIDGKLLAIGYNPYWTTRYDSKIVKLELNFLSNNGKMVPLILQNIVDYNIVYLKDVKKDVKKSKNNKINEIELILLSVERNEKEEYKKVRFEMIYDD